MPPSGISGNVMMLSVLLWCAMSSGCLEEQVSEGGALEVHELVAGETMVQPG
jgi:hypothetical protein